jgi:hypothetical protein
LDDENLAPLPSFTGAAGVVSEQSDESFRRSRELEDARSGDRSYVDNTYGQAAELEKIDKLPQESRENIRDQLVDIIVESGEWEPSDALGEYPYEPTEAAQGDPALMEQEQEAWDEQIEKYHEREAAAWGAHKGPVPGPGNPTGQEGGQQGEAGAQGGDEGDGGGSPRSAGTYQPYQSSPGGSGDETSTAGVSESALDFLKARQQAASAPGGQPQASPEQQAQAQAQQQAQDPSEQQPSQEQSQDPAQEQQQQAQQDEQEQSQQASAEEFSEQQQENTPEVELDTRGIIAIEDLEKLEGATPGQDPDDDSGQP